MAVAFYESFLDTQTSMYQILLTLIPYFFLPDMFGRFFVEFSDGHRSLIWGVDSYTSILVVNVAVFGESIG